MRDQVQKYFYQVMDSENKFWCNGKIIFGYPFNIVKIINLSWWPSAVSIFPAFSFIFFTPKFQFHLVAYLWWTQQLYGSFSDYFLDIDQYPFGHHMHHRPRYHTQTEPGICRTSPLCPFAQTSSRIRLYFKKLTLRYRKKIEHLKNKILYGNYLFKSYHMTNSRLVVYTDLLAVPIAEFATTA
jgi:hypothetical protein